MEAAAGAREEPGWAPVPHAAGDGDPVAAAPSRFAPAPDDIEAGFPATPALGRLRGGIVLGLFLTATVIGIPIQVVALGLRAAVARRRIPHLYHRLVCRILGVRIVVHGRPARGGRVLFVANHCSWLDIPVLSAVAPVSFIAKHEVADWPFFGLLAKLQRTVFIERDRRGETGRYRDAIRDRLDADDNLVLFPEGTSSAGNKVLPFKSALFAVAEAPAEATAAAPLIQPVSVAYTGLCGLPLQRPERPFVAWYGDMELVPHLWELVRRGPIEASIVFHAPLARDTTRKRMATLARHRVGEGVALAIAGRLDALPPAAPDPAAA